MGKKTAINIIHAAVDMITVHEYNPYNPVVKVAAFAVYCALSSSQRFLLESIKLNGRVGRIVIGGNVETVLKDLTTMDFVRKDEATGRYVLTKIAATIMASSQIDPDRHVHWYIEDCADVD